ncbi:arginase family protein [Lagierella sp.]|uniref:arginase family protein n=1 Tax=Lagierella sp. TaxID=2849657 RepID=UPI0026101CEF|nr:arginase family protein [Lagierella sp.]
MLKLNYDILTINKIADHYLVKNILNGKILETSEDVIKIMNYMRNYFTIEECAIKFNLERKVVSSIVSEIRKIGGMIGDDVSNITSNFTYLSNAFFDSNNEPELGRVGLLGIPYDGATTGASGSKLAPNIIRNYTSDYTAKYTRIDGEPYISYPNIDVFKDEKIFDLGDICLLPGESSYEVHKRIKGIYKNQILNHRNKIIAIGGDHSITYPILDSFNKDFILVKFDAHYDDNLILNDVVNHANYISAARNITKMRDVIHVGIRELRKPGLEKSGFVLSADDYIKHGFEKINRYISTAESTNFYISIDLDVLDPSIAPGTGFTLPFGLKTNEIFDIILKLKKIGNLIGADIVEYNPLLDKNNNTLYTALDILRFLIKNL